MKNIISRIAKIFEIIFFYLIAAPVFIITLIAAVIVCAVGALPYALCVRIANGSCTLCDCMFNNIYKAVGIKKEDEEDFSDEDEYLEIID